MRGKSRAKKLTQTQSDITPQEHQPHYGFEEDMPISMSSSSSCVRELLPHFSNLNANRPPLCRRSGSGLRSIGSFPMASAAEVPPLDSILTSSSSSSPLPAAVTEELAVPEQMGGKMVAELVGAYNELTERMGGGLVLSSRSSHLLFKSLKLSIPLLHHLPVGPDGRSPLSRALSVASLLADLQMDAEVISASILRLAMETGAITMVDVKTQIGATTSHLLHENMRLTKLPSTVDVLDNDTSAVLRKFCLTYYDIRSMMLELALKLDTMRHLDELLPRYTQQKVSLEVLQIYAPLAHAIGAGTLSLELEDLSFRCLFPHSYLYIDTWLRTQEDSGEPSLSSCKERLHEALVHDSELQDLVDGIVIKSRYKSCFSTMKKLLRDGRRPEDVHDLLGLRVVLNINPIHLNGGGGGGRACRRVYEMIKRLWKHVPYRTKDYISRPKKNGYRSLHMAVDFSSNGRNRPLVEIQIRTSEMDSLAVGGGSASHSLYKGGLTDPTEAKRLKSIVLAAAEFAALRLKDDHSVHAGNAVRDPVFGLLDKNGDGRISMEELTSVIEDLGAEGDDAQELMQLVDGNSDGSISSDEFDSFKRQVRFMRNMEKKDGEYRSMLDGKLEMGDSTGLIGVYRKELDDRLVN